MDGHLTILGNMLKTQIEMVSVVAEGALGMVGVLQGIKESQVFQHSFTPQAQQQWNLKTVLKQELLMFL